MSGETKPVYDVGAHFVHYESFDEVDRSDSQPAPSDSHLLIDHSVNAMTHAIIEGSGEFSGPAYILALRDLFAD